MVWGSKDWLTDRLFLSPTFWMFGLVFFISALLVMMALKLEFWGAQSIYPPGAFRKTAAKIGHYAHPTLHHCRPEVFSDNTLLLTCQDGGPIAGPLAFIATMPATDPFGVMAEKSLESAVQKFGDFSCEPAAGRLTCYVASPKPPTRSYAPPQSLQSILLGAGLAVTTDGAPSDFTDAEKQARNARSGIWWDWEIADRPEQADPLAWRVYRDSFLAHSSPQASRAEAQNTFVLLFSAGLSAIFGIVAGYWLGDLRERKRQLERRDELEDRVRAIVDGMRSRIKEIWRAALRGDGSSMLGTWSQLEGIHLDFQRFVQIGREIRPPSANTLETSVALPYDAIPTQVLQQWRREGRSRAALMRDLHEHFSAYEEKGESARTNNLYEHANNMKSAMEELSSEVLQTLKSHYPGGVDEV
jgi:hypothetical protein